MRDGKIPGNGYRPDRHRRDQGKVSVFETHDLVGALYDPNDGDIDPSQLTQALAKGARNLGASIIRFAPVIAYRVQMANGWSNPKKEQFGAEYVVNAAGYYAQRVGEMFKPFRRTNSAHGGDESPIHPNRRDTRHREMVERNRSQASVVARCRYLLLPAARKIRVLNLGPYERNCKAHWISPDDAMPMIFSFQLYQDDLGST